MIEVKDLRKTYRTGAIEFQALRGVDLVIRKGEFVAIMGPSGSGKSTLMHLLGFLDSPDGGSYRLDKQETVGLSEIEYAEWRRKKVGFVFQQFHLLPRMKVWENVALPLVYAGTKVDRQEILQLLKRVGLGEKSENRPNELSGGERQRVAIARALVNEPDIIMADEPTGNLDSRTQTEIMDLLVTLNKEGRTIIMVTHEEEVAEYARRIIRIKDGHVIGDEMKKRAHAFSEKVHPQDLSALKNKNAFNKMEFAEFIRQALASIVGNKMRSFLSMLGILIGVAAVITMLALGEGAKESINRSLSSLGSNLLSVMPGAQRTAGVAMQAGSVTRFRVKDMDSLRTLEYVKHVVGNVNGRAQVVAHGNNWNTQVQGVSPEYEEIKSAKPESGRFFTRAEMLQRRKVVLLGQTVASALFGESDPVGQTVRINRIPFEVIGILPAKGAAGFRDQDDVVVVPLLTAMYRLLGKQYLDSIDIQVTEMEKMQEVQDRTMEVLMKELGIPRNGTAGFQIRNMADIQKSVKETTGAMTKLLGFIAAISLLVGGIGIMNIMLVSVTERTREIGLRKAIGGRRRDILGQFLVESVLMTSLGGTAGILIGMTLSLVLSALANWTVKISMASVIISLVFSVAVGLVFGMLPARKAADLNPIDALRYE